MILEYKFETFRGDETALIHQRLISEIITPYKFKIKKYDFR